MMLVVSSHLISYLPPCLEPRHQVNNGDCPMIDFIPAEWRGMKQPEEWSELLLAHRDALLAEAPEDLQVRERGSFLCL